MLFFSVRVFLAVLPPVVATSTTTRESTHTHTLHGLCGPLSVIAIIIEVLSAAHTAQTRERMAHVLGTICWAHRRRRRWRNHVWCGTNKKCIGITSHFVGDYKAREKAQNWINESKLMYEKSRSGDAAAACANNKINFPAVAARCFSYPMLLPTTALFAFKISTNLPITRPIICVS